MPVHLARFWKVTFHVRGWVHEKHHEWLGAIVPEAVRDASWHVGGIERTDRLLHALDDRRRTPLHDGHLLLAIMVVQRD